MRHHHPKLDWMNANSFQDRAAETDGKEVIPRRMANTNATTPVSGEFDLGSYSTNGINNFLKTNLLLRNIPLSIS